MKTFHKSVVTLKSGFFTKKNNKIISVSKSPIVTFHYVAYLTVSNIERISRR